MDWRDGDEGLLETYIEYRCLPYAQVYGDSEGGWTREPIPCHDGDYPPGGLWDRREPYAMPGQANRFWPKINGVDTNGDQWARWRGNTRGWTNPATEDLGCGFCPGGAPRRLDHPALPGGRIKERFTRAFVLCPTGLLLAFSVSRQKISSQTE